MDCDASLDPRELPRVAGPVLAGDADLVLGARASPAPAPGRCTPGWPTPCWRSSCAGAPASPLTRPRPDARGAPRRALLALGIADRRFGWPLEMVLRAAAAGWRIGEVAVDLPPARGRSKVTGTVRGTARAVRDMAAGAGVSAALVVIAKAPAPGRVKTRLCPPCTPRRRRALAAAALPTRSPRSLATPAARRVLVLDGPAGRWLPPGFEVVAAARRRPRRAPRGRLRRRRRAGAARRHGHAAGHARRCSPRGLAGRLAPGIDAVLGPALDGGYWAHRLRAPQPRGLPRRADERRVRRARPARAAARARAALAARCRRCATSTRSPTPAPSRPLAPAARFARGAAALTGVGMTPRSSSYGAILDGALASPSAARRRAAAPGTLPVDRWLGPGRSRRRARARPRVAARCSTSAAARPPPRRARAPGRAGARRRPLARRGRAWPARARRDACSGSSSIAVPRAGRWRTALLLDGNIGIGGAPDALLRRAAELLAPRRRGARRGRPARRRRSLRERVRLEAAQRAQRVVRAGRASAPTASTGRRARPACACATRWDDGGRWFAELAARREGAARGPFRPGFWRSPLRGPWLTAVLGSLLLLLVLVVAVTGFLSHAAYQPDLGRNAARRRATCRRSASAGRRRRPGSTRSTRACT